MDTYKRIPVNIVRGKGCWVWDDKGKRYLDAVAGIATCALGHSDNALRRSLTHQLNKLQHVSNLYQIPEQEALAKWLVDHSFAERVFFCNSGAEANEAAIKLARKYGHQKRNIERPLILSAKSSFHGRTLATVSATGQPKYHRGFEPLVEGFEFFSYNDIQSLYSLIKNLESNGPRVSALLIEPLQGEGGLHPGDKDFFNKVREVCDDNELLLIFDEVQTGMGRTGKWWGYQELDIEPDAFTIAKGLGGGHAIGALLVNKKANMFEPGDHASTFGGNPFACRAGLTVALEIEKRNLLDQVTKRGEQLKQGLFKILELFPNHFQEVRGWGLMQGLVIKESSALTAQDVVMEAMNYNLLLIAAGPKVIRLVPPLIIKKHEIHKVLKRLENSIKSKI